MSKIDIENFRLHPEEHVPSCTFVQNKCELTDECENWNKHKTLLELNKNIQEEDQHLNNFYHYCADAYKSILDDNKTTKEKLLTNIYDERFSQGIFYDIPLDFTKGPFFNKEDEYTYIYGEETDKKIINGANDELFELADVNNKYITKGMMNVKNNNIWVNGSLAYNKNGIVIRNNDNKVGQPGYICGIFFYNRLGIDIMKKYIIPKLIRDANMNKYNAKSYVYDIMSEIKSLYDINYNNKLKLLDLNNDILIEELYKDSPSEEILYKKLDEKDIKIDALEKRLSTIEAKVEKLLEYIVDSEFINYDGLDKQN